MIVRRRSSASTSTWRCAQFRRPVVAATPTANAPGAQEAMALGCVGRCQAMSIIGAVAQIERAPPCRPAGRQCAAMDVPRRNRWCRPSASIWAREIRAAARAGRLRSVQRRPRRAPPSPAPNSRLPGATAPSLRACLRRKPASACSGAFTRGPRSEVWLARPRRATLAVSAMRRGPLKVRDVAGRQRRQGLDGEAAPGPPPPAPASAPEFPR